MPLVYVVSFVLRLWQILPFLLMLMGAAFYIAVRVDSALFTAVGADADDIYCS